MTETSTPLLTLRNLSVVFPTEMGGAYAIQDLNLSIMPQQVLGLVGESGCGKSMTSLAILGLIPKPGRIASGEIWFQQQNLMTLPEKAWRKLRGSQIALIPQDPMTSLNPLFTIGDQLSEVLVLHRGMTRREAMTESARLLDLVQMPNAKERLGDYPHQFSGGMRQRVMIAMALSCRPKLLIADEPTTALDVTVQAQILKLLAEIQREFQTAIILITHDLGVVAELCDDVAIMYAGRIVEEAPLRSLFRQPLHPYTKGLLNSLPSTERERLEPIPGQPPSLTEIPLGCSFEPRCPQRMAICTSAFPQITRDTDHHHVRCYLYPASSGISPSSVSSF